MITGAWYAAVLLVVGTAAAGRACATWTRRITAAACACAVLLIIIVAGRLWAQTYDAFGGDAPLTFAQARIIALETPWGSGWMWQAGASVATGLAMVVWRWRHAAWPLAAVCASATAFATALTGHAVGMEQLAWITILAHGIHVIAAGWWIGALAIILLVTLDINFERDGDARAALTVAIARFSPVAVAAVMMLVTAGLVATWRHVGSLSGFATPYGLALLAKVAAFCGAALCGLYNWRVLTPAMRTSVDAMRQFRTVAWLEVSLGVVAVVMTAVLGTLSMPEPTNESEHSAQSRAVRSGRSALDEGLQASQIRFER